MRTTKARETIAANEDKLGITFRFLCSRRAEEELIPT